MWWVVSDDYYCQTKCHENLCINHEETGIIFQTEFWDWTFMEYNNHYLFIHNKLQSRAETHLYKLILTSCRSEIFTLNQGECRWCITSQLFQLFLFLFLLLFLFEVGAPRVSLNGFRTGETFIEPLKHVIEITAHRSLTHYLL